MGRTHVAVDAGFWSAARRRLDPAGHEQGGIALTVRTPEMLVVFGAVFPAQREASATRCAFAGDEVDRLRRAVDPVPLGPHVGDRRITFAWAHTHPGHGVFLSPTDRRTAARWRALDPASAPVVIDVGRSGLRDAIGVFDTDDRAVPAVRVTAGVVAPGAVTRIRDAVAGAYAADGRPTPLVLLDEGGRR